MKATKISVRLLDNGGLVAPALVAAFTPFGSLTEGVDGQALAEAMIRWINAKSYEQPGLANELIGLVWSATTDQLSTAEVGSWEVSLRTPTSGTRIRLRRLAGGYDVEVDFGPNGSKSRAMQILAAAERSKVRFDAYNGEDRIERSDVLEALLMRARATLARLEGLPSGYYAEYRAEAERKAWEEVAFFRKATA